MKLYGLPLSNYSNMVKHALLEKGIEFEYVSTRPSQEADFLAKSPMGKVPLLETEQGFLTETSVIMDYLEDSHPQPALLPSEPFARAKVRQLIKVQDLYVETPVHALIGVLFGREIPPAVKDMCPEQTRRGLAALSRLVNFSPYICGKDFSFADIFVYHSFVLSNKLTQQVYEWDLMEEVPGLADWFTMMTERETTQKVLAEMQQQA